MPGGRKHGRTKPARAPRMDGEERRRQIAEAALRLSRGGFGAVTMTGVAREVGLAPSALYRHFTGRDEVIRAVVDLLRSRVMDNLGVAETAKSPLEALENFIERQLNFLEAYPAVPRLFFSDLAADEEATLRETLVRTQDFILAGLARIMAQGQEEGVIRVQGSPQDLALMLAGQMLMTIYMHYLRLGSFDLRAQVRRNWRLFKEMLTGERPGMEEVPCDA